MTEDDRDSRDRTRDEEVTAAERAAESEGSGAASPRADPDPSEDAPLVSEEGVNEGATDMVREHPTEERRYEGD